MFFLAAIASRSALACSCVHDAASDVVIEAKDSDCGFADREGRRGNDGPQQAFETLACSGSSGEIRGEPG